MKSFKKRIHQYDNQILAGLIILVAIPVLYLLLLRLEIPVKYVQLSNLHKIIIINGELLILYVLYRIHFWDGWKTTRIENFLRDFLVVNCLFALPFFLFYTDRKQTVNEILKTIRPFLLNGYYAFLVVTGIVVLSTLKGVKWLRDWLSDGINEQRARDITLSKERTEQFVARYPRVSNVKIVGNIVTKVWSIGWEYLAALLVLATLGLVLRLINLEALTPYSDETLHLVAAKAITTGQQTLNQVPYRRSLFTVTLPVALFFKIFGLSLWTARFTGILVNLSALIPLYLLTKKINKPVALVATGLFVFSPWIIATARTVREYAYYPFFFYLTALLMVHFYEDFPDGFILQKDYRKLLTWKNLLILAYLGFNLLYVYIDINSTFKVILVLYPVFGLLLLRKIDWNNPTNIICALFLIASGCIVVGWLVETTGDDFYYVKKKMNDFFLLLFYVKPQQQWYFNRPIISVVLFLFTLLVTRLWDKKRTVLPLTMLVYVVTMLAFSFTKMKTNRPRYAITIEHWHVIVMAVGLFIAYVVIVKILRTKHQWAIWLLLILLFWNIPNTIMPVLEFTRGIHPITTEYHADLIPAYSFLQSNYREEDIVVSTGYLENYYDFIGGLSTDNFIRYRYQKPGSVEVIHNAIETHPQGWIALDYPRGFVLSRPVPLEDFTHAGKEVRFLGWFGDVFILRWGD